VVVAVVVLVVGAWYSVSLVFSVVDYQYIVTLSTRSARVDSERTRQEKR